MGEPTPPGCNERPDDRERRHEPVPEVPGRVDKLGEFQTP